MAGALPAGGAKDLAAMDEAFIDEEIGPDGDFSKWREAAPPMPRSAPRRR